MNKVYSNEDSRMRTITPNFHSISEDLIPEARIVLAILYQAVAEAQDGDKKARQFLKSKDFERWCDLLDISTYARNRLAHSYGQRTVHKRASSELGI